ncbi:MAG TPA: TIGR03936 family radical SAM-associated protein [Verrucomicrobiae bacterium]|nr:TIGR03936 family radical SAM-associated protein [Verrucomicrobiae bacterium]
MRIRVAFAKEDEAKFIGHLDLAKVFERAMRRAEIPMAFSEGFNPHPKIAFGSALALGVTSIREYVDIELARDMLPADFMTILQAQLPKGITLLEAREIPTGSKALMAVLNRASYRVKVPLLLPLEQEKFDEVLARFLAQESIAYVRYSKAKGRQEKNLRPFIQHVRGEVKGELLEVELEVEVGNQGSLKPIELIGVLREFGDLPLDVDGTRVHRQGIYIRNEEGIKSPLDI